MICHIVNSIIAVASNLELTELEQRCHDFWEANLSGDNLVTNLLNAEKYDLRDLRQKAMKRICVEFVDLPIDELQKIDGESLCEVLSYDGLKANGTVIFDRLTQ